MAIVDGLQIKNYKSLNMERTMDEFIVAWEGTMHHVVDIIVDYQNDTYSDRIGDCYRKFLGQPAFSRPGL